MPLHLSWDATILATQIADSIPQLWCSHEDARIRLGRDIFRLLQPDRLRLAAPVVRRSWRASWEQIGSENRYRVDTIGMNRPRPVPPETPGWVGDGRRTRCNQSALQLVSEHHVGKSRLTVLAGMSAAGHFTVIAW